MFGQEVMIINTAEMLTPANYVYVEGMDIAHFMEYMGKSTEHIIPGRFTYALKPQEKHITRETIGIDENAFAIAVVGGRLTDEVTDELLIMFEKCFDCIPDDKKIPAVTVDYGDVAEIVGDHFCCQDYDEMASIIREYITNKKFYEAQAKLAGELADEYLDSSKEFGRIMKEYYKLQGME